MEPESHPLYPWLMDIRREFHRLPELSFQEHRTTARIKELLLSFGIEVQDLPGLETGAVGLIRGRPGPKTLALRADIDALPILERNDVPYRSCHEGRMHACGHDAHSAILLGVARTVMESGLHRAFTGTLKLVFQPAEEKVSGARHMIEIGVMERPRITRILAFHVWPDLPVGEVGVCPGVSNAATDRLNLVIQGQGAHGAHPEQGRDPILAGAHFVTALQSIVSRNLAATESAVLTIGSFHAGTAANILPETAELVGTIRTLRPEIREVVLQRLQDLGAGLERAFEVRAFLEVSEGIPVCWNDPEVTETFGAAAARVLGPKRVLPQTPSMGSEDFGLFTQEAPGALMRLGCANPDRGLTAKLHSPCFDLDEGTLPIGVEIFLEAIRAYLKE